MILNFPKCRIERRANPNPTLSNETILEPFDSEEFNKFSLTKIVTADVLDYERNLCYKYQEDDDIFCPTPNFSDGEFCENPAEIFIGVIG